MRLSIKGSSAGTCAIGATAAASSKAKAESSLTQTGFGGSERMSRRSPEFAQDEASLHLASRDLSGDPFPKRDDTSLIHTPENISGPSAQPTSASSPWAAFPRPDHAISWADVDDSDSDEDVNFGEIHSPVPGLISSFSGDVDPRSHDVLEDTMPSTESSPTPLAPPVAAVVLSAGSTEPVQTHFGFNPLPLGAVPEDAEVVSAGAADGAADPNNRVSVLISAGADAWPKGQRTPVHPRLHGYAGVLTMLHRSVSADSALDPPTNDLAVTSARIEAVLPVGHDEQVKQIVRRAMHGFKAQQEPSAPREGMGGTYFLLDDRGDKVGIFKPCDEEPLAPNNPKGWAGRAMGAPGMKPSVRVGEAALREVAAYLLDRGGFAGVPPAALVLCRHPVLNYKVKMPKIESLMDISAMARCASDVGAAAGGGAGLSRALSRCALSDPAPAAAAAAAAAGTAEQDEWSSHLAGPALPGGYKLGSFQAFASHIGDANDIAPSHFSADNVHRIGILDVRLLNCDRHAGNLLVAERGTAAAVPTAAAAEGTASLPADALRRLVPIDHGFALPEALEEPYFEWQYWPQTNVPFSAEVREYVAALDAQADIAMLRQQIPALRLECLRCLEVTTLVLKACTAAGLTLFEIANVFSRPNEQVPSDFEAMCIDARTDALAADPAPLVAATAPTSEDASSATALGRSPSFAAATAAAGPSAAAAVADSTASPRSSLGMSGLLLAAEEFVASEASASLVVSSPRDIGKAAARNDVSGGGGGASDASPVSPCLAAAGGSAPRQIVSSWLCTAAVLPSTVAQEDDPASPPSVFQMPPVAGGLDVRTRSELLPAVFSGAPRVDVPLPPGSMLNMNCGRGTGAHLRRAHRRNAWASKRGLLGVDPSLVRGVHPQKARYVFTGISDAQWPVFVERMGEYVADELCKGTWRVGRKSCPMAGSCPEPAHVKKIHL